PPRVEGRHGRCAARAAPRDRRRASGFGPAAVGVPHERLDADDLLRVLSDAWRSSGRSKEFPWNADVALQSSLRRVTGEMPEGTGVVVETVDGPALLLVSSEASALVRLADRG